MLLALFAVLAAAAGAAQGADDPALRTAVERYYAAQEAEDAAAYLALWSKGAPRPTADQLKYIFDAGDDRFSGLAILRVTPTREGVFVRVSVTRDRSSAVFRGPDGSPITSHSATTVSLLYVREGAEWKLAREGALVDELAVMLVEAETRQQREQLTAAEPELVGAGLVRSISRLADALAQKTQFALAQGVYERALEIAERLRDPKLQADALLDLGNSMYFQRNFDGALAAYERRLGLERDARNDDGIASALLAVATTRYSRFEYADALTAYREALAIEERQNDQSGLAATLINTGNVQFIQGDYAGAIADYRRSRDLNHLIPNTTGEARALEGLGRSFAAQGDFLAALEAYAGVLEEGRARGNRAMQGNALQNSGEIHFRLGNLDAARPLFDRSREQFQALHDLANVGRVWQAAALTDLVAGRFEAAEQEYGTSSTVCAAVQDSDCVARGVVGVAYAQFSRERFRDAVLSYRKAIAGFAALQKREDAARAEVGLSQALLALADHAGALAAAGRARHAAQASGYDDVLWRAQVAEARALRRAGRADNALLAAREAVETVARMAESALDRPGTAVPADSGGAYALLAVLQAEAGDAAGAFATVEAKHAQALRVALATNERDIAPGMTPGERDAERAAAVGLVTVRAQLDREAALPKPDAARLRRLQESVRAAIAARRTLHDALFARLPDLRTWRGLAAPATAADAALTLDVDGAVLLELVIDDEDLLAVTAVRGAEAVALHARVTPIGRQAVARLVAGALDPAVLRSVPAWQRASRELVAALPAEAWRELAGARRAIVVPDDVLWRVPFEALPVGDQFLSSATAVRYAGSVTSLVRAPAAPPAAPRVRLLGIGSPELPAAVRDRIAATAPGWALRSPESADAEIRTVRERFIEPPAAVLSGAAATEAAFRAQAPDAAVLHVAAPFRMNGASPLFSSLLLSADQTPAGQPDHDGVLEAREVMNLHLTAAVAVFSDGAATSMRDAAPAAAALAWAWRAAGVPSIVIARWVADDPVSAAMLADFHARLRSGETPDLALQGAQGTLRGGEATRAPYFWAGWMVAGG